MEGPLAESVSDWFWRKFMEKFHDEEKMKKKKIVF